MKPFTTPAVCLLSLLAAVPALPAQESKIAEQIEQFTEAYGDRKGTRDAEAQNLIDKMLQAYPKLEKKEQGKVRKALETCLLSGRVKRTPEQPGLFAGAAGALGTMGGDGAKILQKAYKSTKFKSRDWVAMRAVFLKSMGKTKDERVIEFLLERAARDPEDAIMRAAGEALFHYRESSLKVRKKIVKELIKKFAEVYGKAKANLDPGDAQVKRSTQRLDAISKSWNTTLQALTKASHSTPPDWQRFYNKNKNANWDK